MDILFFIVLPIATILIAIVLQKLLKNPILVAILTFAIYLILAYTAFTPDFLINAVVYTILAFITAAVTKLVCYLLRNIGNNNQENNLENRLENIENNIESIQESIAQINQTIANCSCGCNRYYR